MISGSGRQYVLLILWSLQPYVEFKKTIDLGYWAIVCLDDRTTQNVIKDFVYSLQDQAERSGFDIENPKKAYSANRPQEVSFFESGF